MADFEEHNYMMLWPSLTKMSDSKISQKHKKDKDSLSDSPSSTGLRSEKFVTIDVDVQFKPLAVSRSIRFLNLTCQRLRKYILLHVSWTDVMKCGVRKTNFPFVT